MQRTTSDPATLLPIPVQQGINGILDRPGCRRLAAVVVAGVVGYFLNTGTG
ncbi:hypothetical protein J2Z31_003616 [Sinorhizobium kostiense]|uniref:Uncharacterized protein n=1 Tax=Sinorhizobium kostiense TaxID=76747 RepID=A0ABS4R2G6_9HYPH|nr:hypothetical protein [Sinorhizobium kostiense]MBP2237102.1 hypothetical protein [Sinorhizobium kostiense]